VRPNWFTWTESQQYRFAAAAKRTLDVATAAFGLVALLPVVVAVAAAIKISSPGPIFYRQRRVGQHGRVFTVLKFRSMRTEPLPLAGPVWALKDDLRVTRIGRFLRGTGLDELPQLLNVLRGDMSVVGPRAERPEFVSQLVEQFPSYRHRHSVRPGLTGWAQVHRATEAAPRQDTLEKLGYDLFYIKNFSLRLDLLVLLSSIRTAVFRRSRR
jgi:lipopolysaccharide/colanic/teichoic acid biosynthesis glycosyltransferase